MNNLLVSICCITYNHEKYIKECIEGFLSQDVNFDIEFLIHDDASTDSTQDIIRNLVGDDARFDLIFRKVNLKSTGKAIFPILYEKAQGKYIALCEGDDYWTDPLKLQKQVDFLEENEEYSMCYHRVGIEINGTVESGENDIIERRYDKITDKSKIGIKDLLEQGNFIHTVSVMFRRSSLPQTPMELQYSSVGDFFLYVMLTRNGHLIKKIYDVMAVYRRGVGIYTTKKSSDMRFSMLQYRICLLSYLDNNQHKEILLKQTLQKLDEIRLRERQNSNVVLGVKGLFEKILKKIKHAV